MTIFSSYSKRTPEGRNIEQIEEEVSELEKFYQISYPKFYQPPLSERLDRLSKKYRPIRTDCNFSANNKLIELLADAEGLVREYENCIWL